MTAYDQLVTSEPVLSSQRMAVVLSPPPRLAVLDTSVLTTDIIAATRDQEPSSLVAALCHHTYRGFISHRVWAEVPRVLEDRAYEGETFDLDRANELWWTTYLPLLRTVCTTDLPLTPEASRLQREDPTDVPTLQLHGLIAPAVLLASDPDLRRSGLAPRPWRDVRRSLGDMGIPEGKARLVVNFAGGVIEGTAWAVSRAVRLARANVPAAVVVAMLASAGLLLYRRANLREPGRVTTFATSVGEELATAAEPHIARHHRGISVWNAAESGTSGVTALHRIAGLLARAEEPMTRTAILKHLGDVPGRTHQDRMYSLYELLRTYPAFVEVAPHRWELGTDASAVWFCS